MRVKLSLALLLLLFPIAGPGSLALAGEKQTHTATIKSPVYWISRSDLDAAKRWPPDQAGPQATL